ncbi:Uma2 family endonuclease [Spirosoma sp. HMF4905]|uniref:Uma2 family endonuclease n=1 Tax=Spirosoma arboris TaxID=2682092 RepID=A0A7K1S5Z9_9BACT|nr:Uma2 family endonuclease [Spirosoma arboris]MVM29076.1 Uma2 family endonuclease [Spirosoma arboris]
MQTVAQQQPRKRRNSVTVRKQPPVALESLVYEVLDGRPLYYRGYEDVLAGKKLPEDIMGSSSLQWVLVSYFMRIMIRQLDEKKYWFASNEAGVHLDHRNNLSHDVAIYDRSVLTPDKINTQYVTVPAKVAVEIDVKADISKVIDFNYVNQKTKKLLDFGSDKVIWIFTSSQQVMIAEKNADAWLTMDWNRDLELLDGKSFNIGRYLKEEGIQVTE